jgi:hypothetical protein
MTGTRFSFGSAFIRARISMPEAPGSIMSSSTASGVRFAHARRKAASSAKPSASIPACFSAYNVSSRTLASSST